VVPIAESQHKMATSISEGKASTLAEFKVMEEGGKLYKRYSTFLRKASSLVGYHCMPPCIQQAITVSTNRVLGLRVLSLQGLMGGGEKLDIPAENDFGLPPTDQLLQWALEQGLSLGQVDKFLNLFDAATLLSIPKPSHWKKSGFHGPQERHRYFWYRHTAQLLGWCERREFPAWVLAFVRGEVYPSPIADGEASGIQRRTKGDEGELATKDSQERTSNSCFIAGNGGHGWHHSISGGVAGGKASLVFGFKMV
jgi:hypothetical protein